MYEFIESMVDLYIKNIYEYKENFTEQDVVEKQQELDNIANTDMVLATIRIRPYPEVIKKVDIINKSIGIEKDIDSSNIYYANIKVRTMSTTHDNKVSDIGYTEKLKIERSQKNKFEIVSLETNQTVYYAPYMSDDESLDVELPISESVYYDLMMDITPLDNLRYKFKGVCQDNPFENTKEIYYSDSYNWLYWLYYYKNVDLGFPLDSQGILDDENFKTIFKKGHKYKDDVNSYNEGDILFFGLNDSYIGIYMGDNKFYTLKGAFPKEDIKPKEYNLKDYWNEFNGRVLRYEHPLYD